MSVAVCRNVFLFVISVNRKSTKSFLSASRLVTPSVWKGEAPTDPESEPTLLSHTWHRHVQNSFSQAVLQNQLLLRPESTVFMVTKSNSNPCLKLKWAVQKLQTPEWEASSQNRVVYLLKPRVNTACLETHQRGSPLFSHTNYCQLHFTVCKIQPSNSS